MCLTKIKKQSKPEINFNQSKINKSKEKRKIFNQFFVLLPQKCLENGFICLCNQSIGVHSFRVDWLADEVDGRIANMLREQLSHWIKRDKDRLWKWSDGLDSGSNQ